MDAPRRERHREELRRTLGELYDEPLPAVVPARLERGAKLYDLLCRSCHGPTGRGNGRSARALTIRPPDLVDAQQASFLSDRAKLEVIANGAPGTTMIGWSDMLGQDDRVAVLAFMNTFDDQVQAP